MKVEDCKLRHIGIMFDDHTEDKEQFVEISDWQNGEGWDIVMNEHTRFGMSRTMFDVLQYAVAKAELE